MINNETEVSVGLELGEWEEGCASGPPLPSLAQNVKSGRTSEMQEQRRAWTRLDLPDLPQLPDFVTGAASGLQQSNAGETGAKKAGPGPDQSPHQPPTQASRASRYAQLSQSQSVQGKHGIYGTYGSRSRNRPAGIDIPDSTLLSFLARSVLPTLATLGKSGQDFNGRRSGSISALSASLIRCRH